MPNVISDRFSDTPPGAAPYALGPLANPGPTRATPTPTPTPSLADRAKGFMDRAVAGMSSLLGRDTTAPTPTPTPMSRTNQLEAGLDALQARSSQPVPNILSAVPQIPPVQPPPPTPPPRGQPTPFSLNTWLSAQTSKS